MADRPGRSRTTRRGAALLGLLLLLVLPAVSELASGSHAPAVPSPGIVGGAPRHVGAPHPGLIPHRGHRSPHVGTPRPLTVYPYNFYTTSPAPFGITDFGLDAAGNPYSYTSSAILGDTVIRGLHVYNNSSFDFYSLTIQLNIVLTFQVAGTSYYYWVQDVAFLNTSTRIIDFENNIWNFTGGGIDSNSVSGNGSIYFGSVYIASAAAGLPGNLVTLTYPADVALRCEAKVSNGHPMVVFDYRDGKGWQTYDNAVFPFAGGATGVNYTVNGTGYNPFGLYNDAELILGGPGGGSGTHATSANLTMSLDYFNGVNFQSVPNAYNFGSDTAETISGVSSAFAHGGANGTLADNLTAGTATPGPLFDVTQDGYVGIQTLVPSGAVVVNGTTGIAFKGNPINLTIAAGNYTFALYSGGTLQGSATATVPAGGFVELYIAAGTVSTITFEETGLPVGHPWTVLFGLGQTTTRSASVGFPAINLTYGWRIATISGFFPNATHGTLTVTGQNVTIPIAFTQVVYNLTLFESGLPAGTTWTVNVNNQSFSTSSASLRFVLPNGSFAFRVSEIPGWIGTRGNSGLLSVRGFSLTRTIAFRPFTFNVTATETGLTGTTRWQLDVGSLWVNGSVPVLSIAEPNGSYAYRVVPPSGWMAVGGNGTADVNGGAVAISVSFAPYLYPVLFLESGLLEGSVWSVNVSGLVASAGSPGISVQLPNGSYAYAVEPFPGYSVVGVAQATFAVDGSPVEINVTFSPLPAVTGELVLTVVPAKASVTVDGIAHAPVAGVVDLQLPVGVHAVVVSAPGYHTDYRNFTLSAGARTVVTIPLVALNPHSPQGTVPPSTPSPQARILGLPVGEFELVVAGALAAAAAIGGAVWAARRRRSP